MPHLRFLSCFSLERSLASTLIFISQYLKYALKSIPILEKNTNCSSSGWRKYGQGTAEGCFGFKEVFLQEGCICNGPKRNLEHCIILGRQYTSGWKCIKEERQKNEELFSSSTSTREWFYIPRSSGRWIRRDDHERNYERKGKIRLTYTNSFGCSKKFFFSGR